PAGAGADATIGQLERAWRTETSRHRPFFRGPFRREGVRRGASLEPMEEPSWFGTIRMCDSIRGPDHNVEAQAASFACLSVGSRARSSLFAGRDLIRRMPGSGREQP